MKKKVRIYKQGGEGKFINKTAQFLYKAQEGGTYDPNAMGYPGSNQQAQQQAQLNDNQLAAIVVQDISNSTPKEAIVMKLVNAHGKDPLQANQLVDQMYLYLEEKSEKEKANAEDDDEYENTDVPPVAEPEVKPDRLNYDDDNDEGLAAAMEDEEVDDDDSEAAMNLIMRYGGLHKSQDGDAVNAELWNTENNQVEFPGIESYMPQSYVDMYGNTNESIAARAWQEPTEEEEVVEDTSYTEPVVDPSTLKKGGTYKTNKRNFVKSILGLVKKQIGGEEETTSSSPDPTGQDVRTNNLNSFLGILKNQSKLAIAEEEANQYFDEQQQTPMAQEGGDMENPMHHLQLYSDATKSIFSNPQNMNVRAQNGIEVGTNFQNLSNRQQRQLGRLYRNIGQNMPGMPPIYNNRAGVQLPQLGGYGVGPITKFEVTRSGILGNPRRYSMNFGPSTGQGIGMGVGMGVGTGAGASVGSIKAKVIKSNKVIAANIINSVAIKEVATTTPTTATIIAAAQTSNFDLEKGKQADLNPTIVPSGTNTTTNPVSTQWQSDLEKAKVSAAYAAKVKADALIPDYIKSGNVDDPNTPIDESLIWSSTTSQDDYNAANNAYKLANYDLNALTPEQQNILNQAYYKTKNSKGEEFSSAAGYGSPEYEDKLNALNTDFDKQEALYYAGQKAAGLFDPNNPDHIIEWSTEYLNNLKEYGGIVNQVQPDEYGNLQRFVYGGDDEEQIDYNNSVDTTDPYFQRGGRVRAGLGNAMRSLGQLLPVNLPSYAGSYNDVSQAYDPSTGQLVNPRILGNELTSYKVTKSGLISGRPKKYTMYFNGAEKPVLPGSGLNSNTNLNKALTVKEIKDLTLKERNELARNPNISQGKDKWSRKDRNAEDKRIRVANRKGIELNPFEDNDLTKFTDDKDKAIAPVVEYIEDSERKPDEVNAIPIPQTSLNEEDYMDQRLRDEGLEPNMSSVIKNVVDLKTSIKPEEVNAILDNIDQDEVVDDAVVDNAEIVEEPEEDINDFITNNDLSTNDQTTMLDNPMYNQPTEELTMDDAAADYYQNSLNVNANGPAPDLAPGPMSTVENKPIVTYAQLEEQAFQDSLDDYTNEYNPLREDFDEQRAQKISDREMENIPMETISPIDAFSSYYNPYLETLNDQKIQGKPKPKPKTKPKAPVVNINKNPYTKGTEMYYVWNDLSPKEKINLVKQQNSVYKKIEDKKNKTISNYKTFDIDFSKDHQKGDYSRSDAKSAKDYYRKYVEPEIQAIIDRYAVSLSKLQKNNTTENQKTIAKLVANREQDIKRKNREFYEQAGYATVGSELIRNKPSNDQAIKFREWLNKYHKNEAKRFDLSPKGSADSASFQNAWNNWGTTFLYKYQLGGSLNNFLPQAKDGDESPIAYPKPGPEEEEEFDNMLKTFGPPIDDVPIVPKPPEKRDYEVQNLPFTGPVAAFDPRVEDVETYDKRIDKNDPFALDVKVKNQFEVDNESLLQLGNAGVEGVLGAIDKRQNLKRERPMYDNLSADNLYAAKTTKDRGDYVASGSGSGLFRPDEQGQTWNSRSKQYGGENYQPDYTSIEDNIYESTFEDGGFYEDDETYMTQDQIDQYLAAGGEIEYI